MKISYNELARFVPNLRMAGRKHLLHVGCGSAPKERLPECFRTGDWNEIRVDIDPDVKPDIVANLSDMSMVRSSTIDAVWSSHSLEHLEDYQVPAALGEFRRVLKPGGFALITMPDLEYVAKLVSEGKGDDVLYTSPAGPITPLDMMFGHKKSIANGNLHMAHRTGFTADRLKAKLAEAGFAEVRVLPGRSYDLWAVAVTGGVSAVAANAGTGVGVR